MFGFQEQVHTDVLRKTASEVSGLLGALQGDFDELQYCVRRTARYWVGPAGDQFRLEFDAEKAETDEILALMKQYHADLFSIAGAYEDAERRNTQLSTVLSSDIL